MTLSLTENGIEMMFKETPKDILVQVLNLKRKGNNYLSCELSDSLFKIKAYIDDPIITENDNNAFIKIIRYGLLKNPDKNIGVVVHTCEVIDYYNGELGSPVDYLEYEAKEIKNVRPVIDKFRLKSNANLISSEKLEEKNSEKSRQETEQKVKKGPIVQTPSKQIKLGEVEGSVENFEKISDLYPDFPNWQIVARLTKKSYKEFISKSGKGKETKVLNVEFMDAAGDKITGAMFGDSAKEFHEILQENEIYQVSKGQIREDQYNQNKGKNFCKFTLIFTRQSEFKRCLNTNLVPEYKSALKDLQTIALSHKIGEEYDAVGIITFINEEVEIPKDNKSLFKHVMEIYDPVSETSMEAIIWNRHIAVNEKFLNKTVGVFGFRLNQYNDRLSLNSSYHSELKFLENHEYNKYEGELEEKNKVDFCSEKKDKNGIEVEVNLKNLKELDKEIESIEEGKEIRSTLILTLVQLSLKNWSYESCPFCRKSAEPYNRCMGCEKYIEETVPRYKLNVELSDFCGSIWATGFEEIGSKLFSDVPEGIKGINKLEDSERLRLFEKQQFQEFTVKVTSKIDRENQVKHTINKVYESSLVYKTQENIKKIKTMILV